MKIEKIKNILLVLLIISLMILTYITWHIGLTNANVPEDSWFYKISNIFTKDSDIITKEIYVPMPIEITIKNESELYSQEYSADVKIVYEATKNIIFKSLNIKNEIKKDSDENFNKALDENVIIMRYADNITLNMLRASLGITLETNNMFIETIVFSPKNIFIREALTGDIFSYQNNGLTTFNISGNDYILSKDYKKSNLHPEIALSMGLYRYSQIEEKSSKIMPDEIVKAFSYNPYIVKKYESGGQTVYVENFSTIKIDAQKIEFDVTDVRGGIKIMGGADESSSTKYIKKIDRVKSILTEIFPDKNIEFDKIYTDKNTGREVIIFKQLISNIEILEETDFAKFEFIDNVLVRANININSFVLSREKVYILPKKQASILSDKKSLRLVYEKSADKIYKPVWKGV